MFNLQGEYSQFFIIGIMFVLVYVLMIRPQQRKAKEQKDMLAAIAIGDEIITAGGIFGRVIQIAENHVKLEIAQGEVFLQKTAIAGILPKGTLDSLEPSTFAQNAMFSANETVQPANDQSANDQPANETPSSDDTTQKP